MSRVRNWLRKRRKIKGKNKLDSLDELIKEPVQCGIFISNLNGSKQQSLDVINPKTLKKIYNKHVGDVNDKKY